MDLARQRHARDSGFRRDRRVFPWIAILHAIWRELRDISEGFCERCVTDGDEIEETLEVSEKTAP